jgi:hypothetical protein
MRFDDFEIDAMIRATILSEAWRRFRLVITHGSCKLLMRSGFAVIKTVQGVVKRYWQADNPGC